MKGRGFEPFPDPGEEQPARPATGGLAGLRSRGGARYPRRRVKVSGLDSLCPTPGSIRWKKRLNLKSSNHRTTESVWETVLGCFFLAGLFWVALALL